MELLYHSTRNSSPLVPASAAILQGLAPDGGLYGPQHIPAYTRPLSELAGMSYRETAFAVMSLYLTDFTREELMACIDGAYGARFDIPQITRLKEADGAWFLELFHGETIAFKDMALSILPHLMTTAAKKQGVSDEIVILTATSGDTGKAALAGFADVPGTRIIVFYPKNGVSAIQERQMVTQKGANTFVAGIHGNFDDAQSGVKAIFGDEAMREELAGAGKRLSSANSINIGRLVPQIVYYFYAYGRLLEDGVLKAGDPMNVTVPTGNFGNILAAWYAKQMGLPVKTLLCASNENRVLADFFGTGCYDRNRPFVLTNSPSMDILISSNLERLLYAVSGEDTKAVAGFMAELSSTGRYAVTEEMRGGMKDFVSGCATQEETLGEIRRLFTDAGYVIDTHTAVASFVYARYRKETGDETPTVIASTASPYKFTGSVLEALEPGDANAALSDLEKADRLCAISGVPVPAAVTALKDAPVLHDTVVDAAQMKALVRGLLLGADRA